MKRRSIFFAFALAAMAAALGAAAAPHGPTGLAAAMPDLPSPATTGIGITSLISLGYLTFDASPSARQISDMRSPFFAIRDGNVSFSRSSWMGMTRRDS
jgi:hypothetical protein